MTEAEFLLEVQVVPLDPPAQLGPINQVGETDLGRQRGQPVFGGLRLTLGPFDQQPFLAGCSASHRTDAQTGKARSEGCAVLAPGAGSLAAGLFALLKGASVLRVHDVRETIQAIRVWSKLLHDDII